MYYTWRSALLFLHAWLNAIFLFCFVLSMPDVFFSLAMVTNCK